ncbi:asparagine synthase-related protein [Aeromicrobium sp.]|uniref:asparagine synthase-related protein n=1 Tax=Aeromicrobium sp. TaxID=1871063 RepID=UPI003D6C17C0
MRTKWWTRTRRDQQAHSAEATDFRAHPYVCGAIGRVDEQLLQRLRDGSPATLREVHRSVRGVLFASTDLPRWQHGDDAGHYWFPLTDGDDPTSWEDAAGRRNAAGLQDGPRGTTLHADALGFQDLFTRRIGEALYFSVRIDPLLRLNGAKLHTDWSAWASIFALTAATSDATPFLEVRRTTAATAWVADDRGIHPTGFEPGWLSAEPDGSVTPADALALVEQQVPDVERLSVCLSGGFDSRLMAILGGRHSDQVSTWTTSGDDGRDLDLDLAPAVAGTLGAEHHSLVTGPDAWLDELTTVRRRMDFQTTHHNWFMPLARALRERPEPCLDALAGETLFRAGSFMRAHPDEDNALWDRLSQNRLKDPARWAPGVAADFEKRSRASFAEVTSRFNGHPAAQMLGTLHTRVARASATCPLRLLAPESQVIVPFVHPAVIDAALRVPVADKLDGAFYRKMLMAADPQVASLPSSNDGEPKRKRGSRRQTSPAALRAIAQTIRGSETAVELLGPEFRQALDDVDTLNRLGHTIQGHRVLNWASQFAEWRTTYADVLADDEPT